jgi:hypothetical protein
MQSTRTPRIWNLFDQALRWVAKAGEFLNRKGVYPPVPDADKIQFVEMDNLGEKAYAEKRKNTKSCFYARARLAFHFRQDLP